MNAVRHCRHLSSVAIYMRVRWNGCRLAPDSYKEWFRARIASACPYLAGEDAEVPTLRKRSPLVSVSGVFSDFRMNMG